MNDPDTPLNESDWKALPAYRAALISLIRKSGGELFVEADPIAHEGGTIMYRLEPEGIRFRFVPEGGLQ